MSDKFDFDKLDEEIKNLFNPDITDDEVAEAADNTLFEFGNLYQHHSGLSVNLWIDESGTTRDLSHNSYRIKFQNNTNPKLQSHEMIPMSISDNPEVLLKGKDLSKVNMRIAKEVSEFVKKYKDELQLMVDQKMYFDDFKLMLKEREQLNG